jgi:hypothetical protein
MSLVQIASPNSWPEKSDDPRWQLAERIVASGLLGRSSLLSDFLLYVCDRHIRGLFVEITEQQIGVHVFGRREGYNSNDDNIVRNYARTLRKRIDEYFATKGRHEELRLEIPRGAYVPVFSPARHTAAIEQETQQTTELDNLITVELTSTQIAPRVQDRRENHPPSKTSDGEEGFQARSSPAGDAIFAHFPRTASKRLYLLAALCVLGTIFVGANLFAHHLPSVLSHVMARSSTVAERNQDLWNQIFQQNRDTFIVPADSGLSIMENLTQRPVSLADYTKGIYHTESPTPSKFDSHTIEELGTRGYTSVVVLDFVAHLAQLKEVVPERMLIRHPHDLRMQDLRTGNAILIGSVDANPWGELFEQQLNFRFAYNPKDLNTSPVIISQHPLRGEKTVYSENDLKESLHNTYGVVAFLPNLDGTGHVILVAGINMAGTEAAGRFLLNVDLMAPVLERAACPNGDIRPFEILIEANNLAANASRLRAVSERVN